jgi:hypothetical protein
VTSRRDVHPHHVLRALLSDRFVRDVLGGVRVDPDQVRITLDRRWLDAADTIDLEEIESRGIEVGTLLQAVNPPFDEQPDWRGRRLTPRTRDVLVLALRERAAVAGDRTHSGHLLLGVMASRDPIVSGTFAEHDLRLRQVRPIVQRWGRRAV